MSTSAACVLPAAYSAGVPAVAVMVAATGEVNVDDEAVLGIEYATTNGNVPLPPATVWAGTLQTAPGTTEHSAVVLSGTPSAFASANTSTLVKPFGLAGAATLSVNVSVPLPVLVSTCGAYTVVPAAPVFVLTTLVVTVV
ncbi:hypothetical protein D9M68_488140 [compost metagenome]